MGSACPIADQDKTYEEVMLHCGSAWHAYSFTKTLGVVLQKVAADLKNPKLIIQMVTKREHINFTGIRPMLVETPHPAAMRSEGSKEEWLEYDTYFKENKMIFN